MTTLEHHSYAIALERREVEEERKRNPASEMGFGDLLREEKNLVFEHPYVIDRTITAEQRPWVGRYNRVIRELNKRCSTPN